MTHFQCGDADCDYCKETLLRLQLRRERQRAIRAVVAAQWGVACALFDTRGNTRHSMHPDRLEDFSTWQAETTAVVADLPTAEQIVDGDA